MRPTAVPPAQAMHPISSFAIPTRPTKALEPSGSGASRRGSCITTAPDAACRAICAAPSASPGSRPRAHAASPPRGIATRWPGCSRRSVTSRADLAAHYVTGSPVYGRPLPDLDALLEGRGLAERYAGVLDTALARAASEERAELARVVADDAKAASWMSAASFFNTIAHRTGLFQAAAHNIPGVSLPPPSLERLGARRRCRRQGPDNCLGPVARLPSHAVFPPLPVSRRRIARVGRWWGHGGGI